jgi:hypothetical protein
MTLLLHVLIRGRMKVATFANFWHWHGWWNLELPIWSQNKMPVAISIFTDCTAIKKCIKWMVVATSPLTGVHFSIIAHETWDPSKPLCTMTMTSNTQQTPQPVSCRMLIQLSDHRFWNHSVSKCEGLLHCYWFSSTAYDAYELKLAVIP